MRELADRERRLSRRADPQIQDGRYGFNDNGRDYYGNGSHKDAGLYSDRMMLDDSDRRYR